MNDTTESVTGEETINAARQKHGLPTLLVGGEKSLSVDPDSRLVPCKEAAELLSLPAQWLRDEALGGRLPCLLTGGKGIQAVQFNLPALRKTLLDRAAVEFHSSERDGLLLELFCRAQDALAILTELRDTKEGAMDNPTLIRAISGLTTFVENPGNY